MTELYGHLNVENYFVGGLGLVLLLNKNLYVQQRILLS